MEKVSVYVQLKNGIIGIGKNLQLAMFHTECQMTDSSEPYITIENDVDKIWLGNSVNPKGLCSRIVPEKVIRDITKYMVSLDINAHFDPVAIDLTRDSGIEIKMIDSDMLDVGYMLSDMMLIPVDTTNRFVRTINTSKGWNKILHEARRLNQIQPNRIWWSKRYNGLDFKFYLKGGIIGVVKKYDCYRLPNYLFNKLGYGAVIVDRGYEGGTPSRVRFTNNASVVSAELNMGLINDRCIDVYVNFGHGTYYQVVSPSVYIDKYGVMTYTE